ncbi:unnamed protein product [Discosporangium mesarthrocarpum]
MSLKFLLAVAVVASTATKCAGFGVGTAVGCQWTTETRVRRGYTPLTMGNRRTRRYSKTSSKQAPQTQAAMPVSGAKWLQVLASEPDIKPGSIQVVSGKYKGEDKYFALARHGGRMFATSEACGRCKFPMVKGKVTAIGKPGDGNGGVELVDGEDPTADLLISCPLCGASFDMKTGEARGSKAQGFMQGLVSNVMSQAPTESITAYDSKVLDSGAVLVRVE